MYVGHGHYRLKLKNSGFKLIRQNSGPNPFHTTEQGNHSVNFAFVVLENVAKLKTGFKTNFHLMKGENSIISYCIVLMFKSAKV